MSTAADVQTAWNTNVWANASILAITEKIHAFDATVPITQLSQSETTRWVFEQQVNFFQYTIDRAVSDIGLTGLVEYQYKVAIDYVLEVDKDGLNRAACRNAFETLLSTVKSWSRTWGSTVDYYRPELALPEITNITLNGKQCWRGRYTYTGFKTIST